MEGISTIGNVALLATESIHGRLDGQPRGRGRTESAPNGEATTRHSLRVLMARQTRCALSPVLRLPSPLDLHCIATDPCIDILTGTHSGAALGRPKALERLVIGVTTYQKGLHAPKRINAKRSLSSGRKRVDRPATTAPTTRASLGSFAVNHQSIRTPSATRTMSGHSTIPRPRSSKAADPTNLGTMIANG